MPTSGKAGEYDTEELEVCLETPVENGCVRVLNTMEATLQQFAGVLYALRHSLISI